MTHTSIQLLEWTSAAKDMPKWLEEIARAEEQPGAAKLQAAKEVADTQPRKRKALVAGFLTAGLLARKTNKRRAPAPAPAGGFAGLFR